MASATPDNRWKRTRTAYLVAALAAIGVVILWGVTFYIGRSDWFLLQLQQRGTFGDSFGVENALLSGLALVGVILAIFLQREQLIEQREELRDNRQKETDEAVETRFFQLLSSLETAVNSTRVGQDGAGYVGRQAIRKISITLTHQQLSNRATLKAEHQGRPFTPDQRRADIDQWFTTFYKGAYDAGGKETSVSWGDLLGHLFHLLFHILRYIDENKDIAEVAKCSYISILRAHLSNPELVLLFYNCLSHYGSGEHFMLVEKYRILKHLNLDALPDPDDATLYESALRR
jgi:hypothetical protein